MPRSIRRLRSTSPKRRRNSTMRVSLPSSGSPGSAASARNDPMVATLPERRFFPLEDALERLQRLAHRARLALPAVAVEVQLDHLEQARAGDADEDRARLLALLVRGPGHAGRR